MKTHLKHIWSQFVNNFIPEKWDNITINILDPVREDLKNKDDVIGKIIECKTIAGIPVASYRCFEDDLENIVELLYDCMLWNRKKHLLCFKYNASYIELDRRGFISSWGNSNVFIGLGIGVSISGVMV